MTEARETSEPTDLEDDGSDTDVAGREPPSWELVAAGLIVGAGLLLVGYGIYATQLISTTAGSSPGADQSRLGDAVHAMYVVQSLSPICFGLVLIALGLMYRRMVVRGSA